jgi:hypothetical protein
MGAAQQQASLDWRAMEPRCAPFGAALDVGGGTAALLEIFEADGGMSLRSRLGAAHGLLLLRGVPADGAQDALLRLARLLGSPDDYGALGSGSGRGNVLRLSSELPTEITTVTLSGNLSREEARHPGHAAPPAALLPPCRPCRPATPAVVCVRSRQPQ